MGAMTGTASAWGRTHCDAAKFFDVSDTTYAKHCHQYIFGDTPWSKAENYNTHFNHFESGYWKSGSYTKPAEYHHGQTTPGTPSTPKGDVYAPGYGPNGKTPYN